MRNPEFCKKNSANSFHKIFKEYSPISKKLMLFLIFLLGFKSLKMLNLFSHISQKNKIKILL